MAAIPGGYRGLFAGEPESEKCASTTDRPGGETPSFPKHSLVI